MKHGPAANAVFGSSTRKPPNPKDPRNMTREQRNTMQRKAMRSLYDIERDMTHEIPSKGDYEVPALGSSGYGIKGSGYKNEATGGTTTLIKPTQTKKKVVKKKTTASTKRKPIISDEAFEKRAKAQGQKPRDGKTKGKKVNITDAQFNKRAKAQGQKPTDGKAPKVDKVLSKRELRLENVKRKAANEKAKTNKTAQSIDASKPTSADTKAKQTSAKRSRAKAKRLENRATRIQGRIDRKGKSSAEKRASRKATRQKVRENR